MFDGCITCVIIEFKQKILLKFILTVFTYSELNEIMFFELFHHYYPIFGNLTLNGKYFRGTFNLLFLRNKMRRCIEIFGKINFTFYTLAFAWQSVKTSQSV